LALTATPAGGRDLVRWPVSPLPRLGQGANGQARRKANPGADARTSEDGANRCAQGNA
jgi:hypothetical protein